MSRDGLYKFGLPLLIRVRGPEDMSDRAEGYILQALRENAQNIELYAKSLDGSIFMVRLYYFQSAIGIQL